MSFISNEGLGSSHPSIPINQNQDISALLNSGQVSGNLLNSLNNGSTLLQQTNNNQHTLNDLSTIFLQQQLLSQLQQNSGNSNQSSFIGTGNGQVGNIITNTNPSNNAAIYQQLLNQQHQQQQQNNILLNAATAQNQQPSLSQLLQLQQAQVQNQLQNCGNLQNSTLQTPNIQQYNSAFKSQTQIPPQQSPQQQGSINPTILQQLINAGVSPAILAKLLSGNSQPTNQVNYSPATATQANLLLQQQLHLANQPQMQQNLQQQINKMIEAHKQQQLAEKRAMEERHMLNQLLAAANQNNSVGVSLPLPFQGNNNNLAQQLQVQGISTEEDTQKFIKEYMLKQSGSLNNTPILTQQTHQQLQNQAHQVLVSTGNGIINGLQHQPLLQQQQQAQQLSATINLPQSISIPQSTSSSTPLTKEPSSIQLLKDPKSVTNHIQQLINRNEAIIEPSPVLARRRPYCRQPSNTTVVDNQLASISNRSSFSDKESPTNQINSGGIEYNQTINSNSLESCIRQTSSIEMVNNIPVTSLPSGTGNGSLTNGQPFIRNLDKIHPRGFACEFCNLLFPNKAGLQAHSFRCSRNEEGESINKDSSNSGNVVTPTNVSLPNNNVDNGLTSSTLTPNPLKQQECDNRGSSNLSTNSSIVGNSLKRSFPSIDCMAEDVIKNLPFKLFKMKDLRQMSEQSFSEFAAEAKNIIPTIDQGLLKPGDDENVLIELRTKMLKHAIKKVANYDSNVEENAWNNLLKSDNNLQQQQQSNASDFIKQEIPGVVDGQKNDNNNKTNELSNIVRNSGLFSDSNMRNQSLMDTLSLSPSTHQNIKTAVESAVSYVRQNVSAHMPYSVTINNLSSENQGNNISDESQDAKSSLPNKHRSRNITSETYFCVNTLPVHEEQIDTQSSLFANWKAPLPEENNFSQYLKSCNLKTRTGNKNTYEYTTAKGDVNCLKMTHSTYWYQSKNITDGSVKKEAMDDNCIKEVVELVPVTEEIKKEELPIQQASNRYPVSNISPQTSENSEKSFTITKPPQQTSTNDNNKRIRIESSNGLAGYKTDEVYVYVRGRGRGRYVCERCGIRCKKPSMLKKHLNSHTDIRPFKCIQCNFSFKTKGNLTKHLLSKAHSRKLAEQKSGIELSDQPTTSVNNILSSDEGQLQIITEDPSEAADIVKMGKHEAAFMNIDNESDDEDENRRAPVYERNIYRKYGQEVIIYDRRAHTPPSLWCNPVVPEDTPTWAEPEFNRSCQSAPPASFSEHEIENEEDTKKKQDFMKTIQRIRNESISMVSFLDEMSFANPTNTPTKVNNKHQNLCSNKDLNDNNGCQTNGQVNNIKINISNHLNNTTMDSFLAKDVNEYACDICEKKFRKEQEWILHQHTHTIEKNSHRVKNYYCPKCRTCTRSKTSMLKHIEAFHTLNSATIKNLFLEKLNNNEEVSLSGHVSPNENSSNSSTSSTPTYNINNGSRTFLCNDCNKGFRTHGVLAKHLRSQQHITKMSILGKLNEDQTCALRRNPHCLTKVDTKDCDAARQSIISKANEILEDEKNGITPVMTVIPSDNKT